MQVALLVLIAVGGVSGTAHAILQYDVWYTFDDTLGVQRPGDGIAGWTEAPTTGDEASHFVLGSGESVYFGMDNFWYPGCTKEGYFQLSTTTRGFFYDNYGKILTDAGCGYDPADQPGEATPTAKESWIQGRSESYLYTGEVVFTLSPRPSWEWIRVTNPSSNPVEFNSASGWALSHTPEPSLGLLLLAGIVPLGIGLRRRRRHTAQ